MIGKVSVKKLEATVDVLLPLEMVLLDGLVLVAELIGMPIRFQSSAIIHPDGTRTFTGFAVASDESFDLILSGLGDCKFTSRRLLDVYCRLCCYIHL